MSASVLALLAATAGVFTALVFARAAWHKASDFTAFTGFVSDYQLVPESQVKAASYGLVAAEIAVVLALLVPGGQGIGALLAIALYALYAGAMAVNIRRGRTSIECGCGGAPNLLSPALLVRNGVLAAVAALVMLGGGGAGLSFGEAAVAVALGFLLWAGFLLAEQILSNAMRARALRPR
ncbi:MAG: hypothetical protein IT535_11935 [Bauldia sp.]|nr:hypothetical protein [Bauldia sp.]